MPGSITNYSQILSLLSPKRLASVPTIFNIKTDIEKYGFSLWIQNAAASLYPLLQQLELVLRNSVDNAARQRFGDYWWDAIEYDTTKDNYTKFRNNIREAETKLLKTWREKEAIRLGLKDPKEVTTPPPAFGHDDIIAATTFGAWESVLLEALHTSNNAEKSRYLWPISLTKVFRRLNIIENKPDEARLKLINLLKEIRDYRNRIFHHDCIWIKSKIVDTQTAIDSIREKINLIETIITAISPATINALKVWGIFENARRICSVSELAIYTNLDYQIPNAGLPGVLNQLHLQTDGGKASVPMILNNKACILYQLR